MNNFRLDLYHLYLRRDFQKLFSEIGPCSIQNNHLVYKLTLWTFIVAGFVHEMIHNWFRRLFACSTQNHFQHQCVSLLLVLLVLIIVNSNNKAKLNEISAMKMVLNEPFQFTFMLLIHVRWRMWLNESWLGVMSYKIDTVGNWVQNSGR